MELAAVFKYEPDHQNLLPGKAPVVAWKGVAGDVAKVRAFVAQSSARSACSVFLDEGGYYRNKLNKPAPLGSQWLSPPVEGARKLSILISQVPGTAPQHLRRREVTPPRGEAESQWWLRR